MHSAPVVVAMGVYVIDRRGQGAGRAGQSVLADPTGRRRRQLTRVGRLVACLLGVWLCGLGLAGVGLLPGRLAPWAFLVGSPSSAPRLERLERLWQPKGAAAQSSTTAMGVSFVPALAGSRTRQRVAPVDRSRREGQLHRAHGHTRLRRVEAGRIAPRPRSSLPARSTAPAQSEASGKSGTSKQASTGKAPAAAANHAAGQPRVRPAQAPGSGGLAPGWGIETSAARANTASSNSPPDQAAAPEHSEARGHEKATLTPP